MCYLSNWSRRTWNFRYRLKAHWSIQKKICIPLIRPSILKHVIIVMREDIGNRNHSTGEYEVMGILLTLVQEPELRRNTFVWIQVFKYHFHWFLMIMSILQGFKTSQNLKNLSRSKVNGGCATVLGHTPWVPPHHKKNLVNQSKSQKSFGISTGQYTSFHKNAFFSQV